MIWAGIFAIIIVGTGLVSLRRPGAAIGLMMVMFGLEQLLQAQAALFVNRGNLVNVGVALVALAAAGKLLLHDQGLLRWSKLQALTMLLFAWAFLSSLWTVSPDDFERYFFPQWPYFALYFGLGPVLCYDKDSLKDATITTLVLGIPIMIAFAFLCEWTGRGIRLSVPVMEGGRMRNYTPPLAAASCAATIAILTLAMVSRRTWLKLGGIAVLLLCTYIIVRTQSRGQLVAFCFVASLVYPATHRSTSGRAFFQLVAIMGVLIGVLCAAFIYAGEVAGNRWQRQAMDHALEGRALMARHLFETWIGADPFAWLFGLGVSSSFRISSFYVHNVPVEVLCELGLIGATLFVMFCWKSLKNALLFAAKIPVNYPIRPYAIGFVGIFVFLAILTLKEGTLYAVPHMFFVGILIGRFGQEYSEFERPDYWNVFIDSDEEDVDDEGDPPQTFGSIEAPEAAQV